VALTVSAVGVVHSPLYMRRPELRVHVDRWRAWPDPKDWQVTPETERLLKHWRAHPFSNICPSSAKSKPWCAPAHQAPHSKAFALISISPKIGFVWVCYRPKLAFAGHEPLPCRPESSENAQIAIQ
jgi:hypothetical protein